MIGKPSRLLLAAATALAAIAAHPAANAETLRLLTWGGYAPESVVEMFEAKYPDIDVEVTFSNNEEMIAKLRATGGAGYDLAQPSHDRVFAAQLEYDIYKPMDLSRVNTDGLDPNLLAGVKANTTMDGEVYSVPHVWGSSGLIVNKPRAPDVTGWTDLCDPKYQGKTSMRLKRTILLGFAFAMGEDPFAAYGDLDEYQQLLDRVEEKLIACKDNIKAYWQGGDDLSALMLSGEVVASDSWDSTAFKLYGENPDIVFVPPETGALTWIDTFTIPRKGEADDAAYKWINFTMQPEIATMISESSGAIPAARGGLSLMSQTQKKAVNAAFTEADLANLKFFANIPPGVEDMEGTTLERIKAATGGS